ncbi:MAG: hypothetical protein ACW97V_19985 [Promethearchaeota archaeon]|jgi:uncharacterized protein YchJ
MKKKQAGRKIRPNDLCPCNRSGKKYKRCCGLIKEELRQEEFMREKNKDA